MGLRGRRPRGSLLELSGDFPWKSINTRAPPRPSLCATDARLTQISTRDSRNPSGLFQHLNYQVKKILYSQPRFGSTRGSELERGKRRAVEKSFTEFVKSRTQLFK